jgi:hypothetical protein
MRYFRSMNSCDRPDVIFVPFLDWCDKIISLFGSPFGSIPWFGKAHALKFYFNVMGASRPSRGDDRIEEILYRRLLQSRHLEALFTVDELLFDYTRAKYPSLARKVRYVAEPVEMSGRGTRDDARARLGISPEEFVVLVYGELDRRKAVDCILAAAGEPSFPDHISVLLAGPQDATVREQLAGRNAQHLRRRARLREVDRFLVKQEEYEVFAAADVVWVAYKGFYWSSAVLLQAGLMRRPIVACPEGHIGVMNRKHVLGPEVNPGDRTAVARTLSELAGDPEAVADYARNGAAVASRHSSKAFGEEIWSVMGGHNEPD